MTEKNKNQFAVIQTGGKQYRVVNGDIIDVELLEAAQGEKVEFKDVLLFNKGGEKSEFKFGKPNVSGCVVTGEVVEFVTGPKVMSVKYKRSHHQYRKFGHRQHYSRIKITGIQA